MKKDKLKYWIFVVLLMVLFTNCKNDEMINLDDVVDYDKYFDTRGYVELNNAEYQLNYGAISLVNSTKNTNSFKLILFDINIFAELIENETDLLIRTPYTEIEMEIVTPSTNDFPEGEYVYSSSKVKQPLTFINSKFSISEKSGSNNYIGTYLITEGNITINAVNEYPFPGYASIMINATFSFVLENSDTIQGEYIGRVIK